MARIIYIEDESYWIAIARRALADHIVDSADNFDEALALIRGNPPYDLALVDLNLERDDDGLGGEILDLLNDDYPLTRRVVITARPPIGGVRRNIFERYGADEILIKGELMLPDLRKVVAAALRESDGRLPHDVRIRKAVLTQRYRDWRDHLEHLIEERVFRAQEYVSNAAKLHGQSMRRAQGEVDRWNALRERFFKECLRLESMLSEILSSESALGAMEELEQTESRFASEIRTETSGTSGI